MSLRIESLRDWLAATPPGREQALAACLKRIGERDAEIRAWVQVAPPASTGNGPLAGIPFGAKEIVETEGLLTEYGSAIYRGRVGTEDAAIIRLLRERGAVLVGKTRSTPFAYFTPTETRNPRNLAHTPGGSSSGSAAAVAAGMVPFAIGTQTAGSILRPASFCGVTGFKPTFDLLPTEGVLPFAQSLDTVGFFTSTAADMIALWEALGFSADGTEEVTFGVPDPLPAVDPAMATTVGDAVARLRRAGCPVRTINLTAALDEIRPAQRTIFFYEGARFHEERFRQFGSRLEHLADLVREGLEIPAARYDEARREIAQIRARMAELFKATPVILVPAAVGPAPAGLDSTGDPRMNAPWTALGTPAISVPMPVAGLPMGLQLVSNVGQDDRLLRAAGQVERILNTGH